VIIYNFEVKNLMTIDWAWWEWIYSCDAESKWSFVLVKVEVAESKC